MEAHVTAETLPAVAAALREWIPALAGRAIPVTEILVTKENLPSLPIAAVAPLIQNFTHNGGLKMTVSEEFTIDIWLPPEREQTAEGGETPFWSYYEYNKFRNELFSKFAGWRSPQNGRVSFVSMDVESNFLATVLTFRLRCVYDICADDSELEDPREIVITLCPPATPVCPAPECCEQQETDPCLAST